MKKLDHAAGAAVGGERMYSRNLRDLLRMEDYHHNNLSQNTTGGGGGGGDSSSGLTLYAVLTEKRGPSPSAEPLQRARSNRTLLDIIREDRISGDRIEGRLTWRYLTDKIRLRRRDIVSDWPTLDLIPRRNSTPSSPNLDSVGNQASIVTGNEEEEDEGPGADTVGGEEEEAAERDRRGAEPSRMSLMALLAETDRQMGFEGSSYVMIGEDDVDGCDADNAGVGVEYNNCCVCMVRHKGAAFIPCGHTFCRVCSREVWVQRGNCPLCNNAIVEILDIF